MKRERIERKMAELVDWPAVRFHAETIEVYLGKMLAHRLDYTGDIRAELERIEEIMKQAEEKAVDEIIAEDDRELEEICMPASSAICKGEGAW
jgi:hypothetical protein